MDDVETLCLNSNFDSSLDFSFQFELKFGLQADSPSSWSGMLHIGAKQSDCGQLAALAVRMALLELLYGLPYGIALWHIVDASACFWT